jgi:hypothetical protein
VRGEPMIKIQMRIDAPVTHFQKVALEDQFEER